jgi:ribonuclease Z
MTTSVTLTGTGVPHPSPGRAGPGALVRVDDIALQFDAGRGTVLRLTETGTDQAHLAAVFVTHVHSDHVVDLADVAMTRWILQQLITTGPLEIVVPRGAPERFVCRMLEPFADDIAVRMAHGQPGPPEMKVTPFEVSETPTEVWTSPDGSVVVDAVGVHHEPVSEAVAYRITSSDGRIVISGDTRACKEVEQLSQDADILVHEACRATALRHLVAGTRIEAIFDYHADTVEVGALASRAKVRHLVLTHLIPAPGSPEEEQGFVDDVRSGGFTGQLSVGGDLMRIAVESPAENSR